MTDLSWLTARPIAHRGLHDLNCACWENTLSAFELAAARNYAIECDVHLSADGVPVIFHDDELARVTGQHGPVAALRAADLCALAVGGTADRIPTLADALQRVDGRVPMVIELKGAEESGADLVKAVASVLETYRGEAALMSFQHWFVRDLARAAPGRPAGLTACGTGRADIEAHFSMLAHDLSFVSYALADLPNRFVSFCRERLSMPVISWTVLDPSGAEKSRLHADQITFEGFDPAATQAVSS